MALRYLISLFLVICLALPVKPLCREECAGLCPRCGADRNAGACGCPEPEGDSPFAVLKSLRDGHVLDIGHAREGWKWDSRADIQCPRCGKDMEKSADSRQQHIWYEVCVEHGLFMDAGEFTDFKFESLLDRFRALIKGSRGTIAP